MEMIKISHWQAAFLIVHTILPTAVLTVPSIVVKYSQVDAWLSVLIATGFGLFVAVVSSSLSLQYPGQTLFQITERTLGSWFSKGLGILLTFYYFFSACYVLHEFADFMAQSVMQKTPSLVFHIVMILLMIYAVHMGLEVIARVNSIILFISFFALMISTLFIIKDMKFDRLLPFMDTPFHSILLGSYIPAGWMSEVSIILLLAPYIQNVDRVRKSAVAGVLITGLSLTWTLIGAITIFGVKILPEFSYPTFNVFRIIQVADFVERIDAIFIAVWIGTMIMKATLFLFGCFYSFCESFKIRNQGFFLFPFAILTVSYSMISWKHAEELNFFSTYTFPTFALVFNLVIPVILLPLVLWKRRIGEKRLGT